MIHYDIERLLVYFAFSNYILIEYLTLIVQLKIMRNSQQNFQCNIIQKQINKQSKYKIKKKKKNFHLMYA